MAWLKCLKGSQPLLLPRPDWARGLPPELSRFGYAWLTGQLLRYLVRPAAQIARPDAPMQTLEAEGRLHLYFILIHWFPFKP